LPVTDHLQGNAVSNARLGSALRMVLDVVRCSTTIVAVIFLHTSYSRHLTGTLLLRGRQLDARSALCRSADVKEREVWRHTIWRQANRNAGLPRKNAPSQT